MRASTISNVVIVGAGPAGLAAAMYLGRFHRKPLVVDAGGSRALWIPASHNIPGFTQGISGPKLLSRLRAQAARYGAEFRQGTVSGISRRDKNFALTVRGRTLTTRFVILATGVKDRFPQLAGVAEAALRSVLRFCPICDGFEATGKRIAVIGNGELGEHEAKFLFQTYSRNVSYLNLGEANCARDAALEAGGIIVRNVRLDELQIKREALSLTSRGGPAEKYDVFYSALGCVPQHQLATSLGAVCDKTMALTVNKHQQTSVNGLYAAGDIVRGLNQVVVAVAEGAIAATDIHNRLRSDNGGR